MALLPELAGHTTGSLQAWLLFLGKEEGSKVRGSLGHYCFGGTDGGEGKRPLVCPAPREGVAWPGTHQAVASLVCPSRKSGLKGMKSPC